MRRKKHLLTLTASMFLSGCGLVNVYDTTRVFYDEVTQKEIVQLQHPRLCDRVNWIPLLAEGPVGDCPVNGYSLAKSSETISVDVLVYSYGGFDPKTAMAEGQVLEITGVPVRIDVSLANRLSFNADTYERFSVALPFNEFVKWSCRDSRVLLRVSGKYDLDIPLAIEPIRQFLAKAQDFGFLDVEDIVCLSRGSSA